VDFVLHEGDTDYGQQPAAFWSTVDSELGHDYPYFLIVGNHEIPEWPGYAAHLMQHMDAINVPIQDPSQTERFSASYMGIRMVFVGQRDNENAEKAQYILSELDDDDPSWKLCNWHKNQTAMQVGGKGNEMGWEVYENCRLKGAIILTGHEHSYSRTKTLTDMENRVVDPTCSDPNQLCVGQGRTFAVVSGLGGNSVRPQLRCGPPYTYPYGCDEWASIYSSNQNGQYGTMFLTFNVGGDPKRASGYFKDIDGNVIDTFEITRD